MTPTKLSVWTDGGSRGNPGHAAIGVVMKDQEGQFVWRDGKYLGAPVSNNQAEYQALWTALKQALDLGAKQLEVFMDSQLVVEQIHGRYKVKDAGLQLWWDRVMALLQQFEEWDVTYVPRSANAEADALVNQVLDQNLGIR